MSYGVFFLIVMAYGVFFFRSVSQRMFLWGEVSYHISRLSNSEKLFENRSLNVEKCFHFSVQILTSSECI